MFDHKKCFELDDGKSHCLEVINYHAPVSYSQLNGVPRHVASLKLWIRHQTSWSLYQDSETGSSAVPLW